MSNIKSAVETKLSDEKCLVVQFINERHKPVQVGFQAWLKKENTESDLSHLLNSEVIIRWPVAEDIKCAKMMEKMIKKKNITWEDLVVRVRSLGIFTDMCQHVKNIELFGVPNPSREERRKLCHKPSGSSNQSHTLDFNSSEDDSEPNKSLKKRKKTETSSIGKSHSLQSPIENLSRDFIKKSSRIDLINNEEEKENDEDGSMFKWSKTKLIDLINTLQIENKKLREDNARLRALRAINEDLHKMTAMSSTLFKDMDKLRRNIDSLRIKADQSSNKNKNSDNINNNNNNIKLSYLNKDEQKENNISHNAGSTSEIVETQSENSQQQILLSIAHIEQPEKF
ncbi:uncharacterized protein DDB_G0288739-like [Nylanderia fulva]|nr:uncharacterized protein DDB_G0288739-like [Nylanderia fulva]